MTIKKEAREMDDAHWCDEHVGKDCLIYDELKSYKKECKAKQDRIDKLEKEFDEYKTNNNSVKWNELLAKRMNQIGKLEEIVREYKWEWESACERERATNQRLKELESALKEITKSNELLRKQHLSDVHARYYQEEKHSEFKRDVSKRIDFCVDRRTKATYDRINKLESALKEIADMTDGIKINNSINQIAKKAIGGGNASA